MMRLRWPILIIALLALAAALCSFFITTDHLLFFRAYLFAFLFCLALSLGSLTLLILHNLTGGDWGYRIRPTLQAAALSLPILAIFFIPICFHLGLLYPWARPDAAADATLLHRHVFFNIPFFLIRAGFYFAIWITMVFVFTRSRPISRGLGAAGLLIYLFTVTHADFDWIMSRDTDFYSTAFGLSVALGQTLSALALALALMPLLPKPAAPPRTEPHMPLLNDLGNILLTLVILWTYVTFMQFLVIWMGNIRDDNHWYVLRGLGSYDPASFPWKIVALALIVTHFFIPFFVLLYRSAKQYLPVLAAIGWLLLCAHILDIYWLVAPSDHYEPRFDPHWLDAALLVALLGIWCFLFLSLFARLHKNPPPAVSLEGAPAHG